MNCYIVIDYNQKIAAPIIAFDSIEKANDYRDKFYKDKDVYKKIGIYKIDVNFEEAETKESVYVLAIPKNGKIYGVYALLKQAEHYLYRFNLVLKKIPFYSSDFINQVEIV